MIKTYTTKELQELWTTIHNTTVARRAKRENWQSQPRQGRGGGKEWLYSSMPQTTQFDIRTAEEKKALEQEQEQEKGMNYHVGLYPYNKNNMSSQNISFSNEKRSIATKKADLVRLYLEFQRKHGKTTKHKDMFIQAYQAETYSELYKVLGDVSWKTLERWKNQQIEANSVIALADKRGIAHRGKSILSNEHRTIILGQILNPNAPLVAQCARKIQSRCEAEGLSVPSEATIRRFVQTYSSECYDEFVLFRQGKKAWNDRCSISVMRDWSLVNVGDIIIADGHTLNFETINPETGKAKRMTLLLFFDGASNHPLGWEIMPTENVECISAAFRRTCMLLGKFPKVVYIDNGRAFRAKFFEGCKDFQQAGIDGLYESLGVQVIHAWAYHGQSKPIERFFGSFLDMEIFTPSYVGNSIANKPARLHRNEKLHQRLHEKTGGRPLTLEETHMAIAKWFCEYTNRKQHRTHLKGATPAEVFDNGKGTGLIKRDIDRLDFLMMQKEIRTITKDGFRLHGKLYWHEVLASRRHEIIVRYDELLSPHSVKVYTLQGEFLCEALDREHHRIAYGVHPAASILGTDSQKLQLVQSIELKKGQERQSSASLKALTENIIIPEARLRNMAMEVKKQAPILPQVKTLSLKEIDAIEAAKVKAIAIQNQVPTYTPSSLKRFRDMLDRYSYLFNVMYEQNLELVLEDMTWLTSFENTQEYIRNYKSRFDGLRDFYTTQQHIA